jgi:hypothetical protein
MRAGDVLSVRYWIVGLSASAAQSEGAPDQQQGDEEADDPLLLPSRSDGSASKHVGGYLTRGR